MIGSRSWHCVHLLAGVIVALLAHGITAPSVQAGCGDHVMIIWNDTTTASLGSLIGNRKAHSRPERPTPARPEAPCTGPHCKRGPILPPPPPLASPGLLGQEWPCMTLPLVFTPDRGFDYLIE